MVAAWRIAKYHRPEAPVTDLVTTFGGQPTWLGEPQWPLSAAWNTPMRFVCQIALDPELSGDGAVRLAYVFVTHGEHGREDKDFDADVIFPDGGENAVVVQPGAFAGPRASLTNGPTLYHRDGSPAELLHEYDWPAGGPWQPLLRLATNWTPHTGILRPGWKGGTA